uniref:Alternative protein DEF8 n=1 Tax=Homo sapiens TaxID=9606 RepID=L8EAV7_HUMAN|nr:alternative protein DEF8 [Homo sapiens]
MPLLGYWSPLTRKPKRRHLSQQKGHLAHWLIPGVGETAGSPLCPPASGRGWCPLPTVVALGKVLIVCSASVSPSGKWGQGS